MRKKKEKEPVLASDSPAASSTEAAAASPAPAASAEAYFLFLQEQIKDIINDIKLLIKSALSIGFTRFSSMSCVLGILLRVYSMFSHSPAPPPPAGSSDVQSKQHLFH